MPARGLSSAGERPGHGDMIVWDYDGYCCEEVSDYEIDERDAYRVACGPCIRVLDTAWERARTEQHSVVHTGIRVE